MSRVLPLLIAALLASPGCSLDEPVDDGGASCPSEFLTGASSGRAIHSGTTGNALAQAFTLAGSATISSAEVMLERTGSPGSTIVATIQSSASGLPNGTALATSSSVTVNTISSSTATTFTFTTPVSLSAGTYHLVLTVGYANTGTAYVTWTGNTSDSFSSGYAVTTDSGDSFEFDSLISDYTISLGCN